jgi:hypothetical protein
MRRQLRLGLALVAAGVLTPRDANAQRRRIPVSDSTGAYVAIASRHLWRDVTLARGAALVTGAALPIRRGLMLEYEGSTAVQNRSRDGAGDQYSLAVNWELPYAPPPHGGSILIGVAGHANPGFGLAQAGLPRVREELLVSVLRDVGVPSQGIRTIALRFDGARDVSRSHSTWLQGSAHASLGTTVVAGVIDHVVKLIGGLSASASDLGSPLARVPQPPFSYHSTDVTLSLDYRRHDPVATKAFSAALDLTEAFRARRLGGSALVVGLRGSVVGQ